VIERNDRESAAGENGWAPVAPPVLMVQQYALPEDRRALARLRTLRPLVYATRMYIRHLGEPMTRAQMLGGAVRVSERQFGHLDRIAETCARMLHLERPEVFVVQEPRLNSHTYGHQRPLVILTSGLVDAMSEGQLAFVLGHEFGHIKSEHVLFVNLAEFLRSGAAASVQWLAAPAMLSLFAWQRYAEQTADRAGLIACQRIADAEAALIKLALGSSELFSQIDVDEYLRQTEGLTTGQAKLALALQNHPYTAQRVASLRAWAASDAYRALWEASPGDGRLPALPPGAERYAEPLNPRVQEWAERCGTRAAEAVHAGVATLRRAQEQLRDWQRTVRLAAPLRRAEVAPAGPAPTVRPDEEPV
jgi:Zn-dependent protease with chaperone function